jgi:hypothetical protein
MGIQIQLDTNHDLENLCAYIINRGTSYRGARVIYWLRNYYTYEQFTLRGKSAFPRYAIVTDTEILLTVRPFAERVTISASDYLDLFT